MICTSSARFFTRWPFVENLTSVASSGLPNTLSANKANYFHMSAEPIITSKAGAYLFFVSGTDHDESVLARKNLIRNYRWVTRPMPRPLFIPNEII